MLLPWLALLIGLGVLSVRILSLVSFWQRKEYRWDRVASVLLTSEAATILTPPLLVSYALVLGGWVSFFNDLPVVAASCGWLSLLLLTWIDTLRTRQRGLFRPKATLKAILILGVSLGLTVWFIWRFFTPESLEALQWATVIVIIPLPVAVSVLLVNLPVALRKRSIIAQAARVRQASPKLTVVGITGSFGKTSTKHFLAQLLKAQSNVAVTADHRNAPLAVAQDMLRHIHPRTQIYIAEMGAYRRGEITELARLLRPQIGCITAIGNQHLALFGSREKLLAAKWELIASLPADGVAVLTYDSLPIRTLAAKLPQKVIWFSATTKVPTGLYAHGTRFEPDAIHTTLTIADRDYPVVIPLLGEAGLGCALCAAALAWALKLPVADIVAGVQQLHPYPRTMELKTNNQGAMIIDDSYTANEPGVMAATIHLARFQQPRKVVVLTPLIELGRESKPAHERIGRALAEHGLQVIMTSSLHQEAVERGGKEKYPQFSVEVIDDPAKLTARLLSETRDTVMLLEGRLPDTVREKVLV